MPNRYQFNASKHMHTLDGKPLIGTSTAGKVLNKPLTWWALQIGLGVLGYMPAKKRVNSKYITNPYEERYMKAKLGLDTINLLNPGEYLELLDMAYHAHDKKKDEAADAGTDMHGQLEQFIKAQLGAPETFGFDLDLNSQIAPFASWCQQYVKRFIASEAHVYSERLWTGGITDCVFEDKEGKICVLDFKSSKEAYQSQFIQGGGYALQIEENGLLTKDGTVVLPPLKADYLIIIPFGAVNDDGSWRFEPVYRYDIEEMKKGFEAEVLLYKLIEQNG